MSQASALVVAIDFSKYGREAFESAVRLAKDLKGRLVLVHAVPGRFLAAGPEYVVAGLRDDVETVEEEEEALELTALANEARSEGLDVEPVLREGDPTTIILEEADKHNAALIILGTHGRTGFRRLVLGSTAEGVSRRSARPVLIVPHPEPE